VLLLSGWQDLFLPSDAASVSATSRAGRRRRADHGAVDPHPAARWQAWPPSPGKPTNGWTPTSAGRPAAPRSGRVRFFVSGEGWRELPDWPPATTEREVYLQPGGGLADTAPTAGSSASFRYDPAEPTPTIGGRLLSPDGGYRDDTELAARRDVLSFTSDVLTNDLYVHGNPVAELAHSSDNPHVDVFVRISEVDAKGRSRNVSDGYRRLTDATDGDTSASNWTRSRTDSGPGSRIRVLIAGGCHPRFDRNLGTGEATSTGSQLKPSTHEVHFGTSRIVLPVGS
jgi:putative CocE/NonD family hydrolase